MAATLCECMPEDARSSDSSAQPQTRGHSGLVVGWICPQCLSVYSPDTAECWRCNGKNDMEIVAVVGPPCDELTVLVDEFARAEDE